MITIFILTVILNYSRFIFSVVSTHITFRIALNKLSNKTKWYLGISENNETECVILNSDLHFQILDNISIFMYIHFVYTIYQLGIFVFGVHMRIQHTQYNYRNSR